MSIRVGESLSITVVGGTRPPAPITVADGNGLSSGSTVTTGDVSSVSVRFGLVPNSVTVPITCTVSPTETVGVLPVKTNTPSDVSRSASGARSWM